MAGKRYLTEEKFDTFMNNHFHTLTREVSELKGAQKIVIAMVAALLALMVAVVVLAVL